MPAVSDRNGAAVVGALGGAIGAASGIVLEEELGRKEGVGGRR